MEPNRQNTWAQSFGFFDQIDIAGKINEHHSRIIKKSGRRSTVSDFEKNRFYQICLRLLKKGYGNKRIIKIAKRIGIMSCFSTATYHHHIRIVRLNNGFFNRVCNDGTIQNRILLLKNKGLSNEEISRILEVAESFVDYRIKKERYKHPKRKHKEVRQMYIDLHNKGLSNAEIAKKMNVTFYTVQRQIKKLGLLAI